jgi:hypothetical protein
MTRALLAITLATICGCGSDDAPIECDVDPSIDPATVSLRGPCPLEDRLGGFTIAENMGYSAVDGKVADGVIPLTVLTEVHVEGDCKLLRRENLMCNPACTTEQSCSHDGTCIATPRNQDLGTVTIDGLSTCVAMTAVQPGNTYFDNDVTHPAFDGGEVIRLTTEPGPFGPLELYGVGVTPFEPLTTTISVSQGSPVSLAWSPPASGARSRVFVSLNIDQHGITPITVYCDFPDDGEAEISASLIDMLYAAGVSGFPNIRMFRRTVDSQAVADGCVELAVTSERQIRIEMQ